jgi:thiamine pyrophosphokinase
VAKRALLLIGGAGPSREALLACAREADLIVAADAGLKAAIEAGLAPDLVVGDMDSLPDRSLLERVPADRIHVFPTDKDETDTEIGLRMAREQGCTHITVAGGGGGRLDHLLGIAALFERPEPPRRWLTDAEDTLFVDGAVEFEARIGGTISVFPMGAIASRMLSEGLAWPLDGLTFQRGYAGISNRASATRVRIEVGIGALLVVRLVREDR